MITYSGWQARLILNVPEDSLDQRHTRTTSSPESTSHHIFNSSMILPCIMPDKHNTDHPENSARELFVAAVGEKYVINSGSLSSWLGPLEEHNSSADCRERNRRFMLKCGEESRGSLVRKANWAKNGKAEIPRSFCFPFSND